MCACESQPAYSASLKPPGGSSLGLQEGVTWIGRGTFEASLRAQLLCSRRQACFTLSGSGLRIECHGINPLLFVVCRSKNLHGTEATPATELFQLRKGEAVDLADGDRFYFAAMECLLTVVIKQNDTAEISRDVLPLPLQQASEARVNENEESLIGDEQQVAKIPPALQDLAQNCGISDPQSIMLKNVSALSASSSKSVARSDRPVVAELWEYLAASNPSVSPMIDCPVSGKAKYESVRNDTEDSDSLGLDAYDCLPLVGVDVQQPLRCVSPQRREEVSDPVVAVDDDNRLNESFQSRAENFIEVALPNSTLDEVPEDDKCAQLPVGEGCRPPCIREDYQAVETSSRDIAHGLGVDEDLPNETCAPNGQIEQREPEDYNLIMSSETVDGQSIDDYLLLSEPARGLAVDNVREYPGELPNVDIGKAASDILHISPVSRIRDAIPVRVAVEHTEVSGRAGERDDPEVSAAAEDDSWPDGPVEGMESVIVSVSGYEGIEKQNLVKLINKTGAAFTGQLSKANTHLVCWNFYGKKFDRAMKLHKPVINHQWFEDSLRAGKKRPESPYKLRCGEDVGPLKWKETPPSLVTERDEPSADGAINQHRVDHGAFFLNTIDQEDQRGQRAVSATASHRKDLPGTSRQAALSNVECGLTGGRKKSRRLVKLSVEQENLVREDSAAPPTGSGEPYPRRTDETLIASEEGYNTRRRKSDSSALHDAGQVHGHDTKRRKSASSIFERYQERGAVDNLRGRGRSQPSAGPDREFTVINLSDDVDEETREIGLQMPQSVSTPVSEGTGADINKGKNPECTPSSQRDREVACAICLVETKSPSEGLLECGHKFCYKCIFTWTVQAANCPLCKASIDFVTRQEVDLSGKLDETVVVVGKKEMGSSSGSQRTVVLDAVCIQCGNNDAESLLMRCGSCGNRAIHTFCMDPPAPPPWFCVACTQNHHRDSLRLAWNQFLPGSSTADLEMRPVTSSVRRRNTQPYSVRRPSRPVSAYRPTLHAELTQNMGPVRRTNVVGQHSLRSWLNETSKEDT